MKKRFFIYSVLAALLMTGCSKSEEDLLQNEEAVNGEAVNGENSGESKTHYLAVSLMSAGGGAGARATRAGESDYNDGTVDENEVSKVRFYFFFDNGEPANVKILGNTYVNYHDWSPKNGEQTWENEDGDYKESLLNAQIVINTKYGDKLPQLIAAVLNPTEDPQQAISLQNLKRLIKDYAANELTQKGKFVMFNSVYAENGAEVCAVPIMSANLATSTEDALKNPVHLHVERNVAKVSFKLGAKDGIDTNDATTGKLALKDKKGNNIVVDGKQIYLKINGWRLTAETDLGRLGKKINPEWPSDTWTWNRIQDFRSLWAINAEGAKNKYYSYNDINTDISKKLYTNENAQDYTNDKGETTNLNRTKVIVNGTLLDEEGNPFTLVRHLGVYFADTESATEEENLPELKKSILSQLKANGNNYYYGIKKVITNEEGKEETVTEFNQIAPEDLKIVITTLKPQENSQNNCYVYAQLTAEAEKKTWYTSMDKDAKPLENAASIINDNLKEKKDDKGNKISGGVDQALVWKSGMTYYYFEIIHRNLSPTPTYGVVRNHIYETTVTKIAGLGTPVYDPTKTIYPEKPENNDHYIAADIEILSWRVVKNDYELEW